MQLISLIQEAQDRLEVAKVHFGQGTTNARDEAVWLVLWKLGLPLDTDLDDPAVASRAIAHADCDAVQQLIQARIETRKPAAYLTREAWLQGLSFYIDERAIVPRSLIAEALVTGHIDAWLDPHSERALDLCTGNGSLAVMTALTYPDLHVDAIDISNDALAIAEINVARYDLGERVHLRCADGLTAFTDESYDLVICNPPYVDAERMATLPPEFLAEPDLALAGGSDGMSFVRPFLALMRKHLNELGVVVLEIGHERAHFESAFPNLMPIWIPTSAGEDQVLLLTKEMLDDADVGGDSA
jgi:ribosomal protein L3 glutamine methyltransferase